MTFISVQKLIDLFKNSVNPCVYQPFILLLYLNKELNETYGNATSTILCLDALGGSLPFCM